MKFPAIWEIVSLMTFHPAAPIQPEHSKTKAALTKETNRLPDATAPIEEADRATTWLESQSKQMLTRAQSIRRRYHQYARYRRGYSDVGRKLMIVLTKKY